MIDFKNYERLTISKGEIKFYDGVYNKCSNQNAPEIREKINNGTLVCDIEEYQSCSYSKKQLRDMYSRLAELEDMIEQGKLVEKIEPKTGMTKEQQIKEMAKIILETERYYKKSLCLNTVGKSRLECIGDSLYNAGYRNIIQTVMEFAEYARKLVRSLNNCLDDNDRPILEDILEHFDEYVEELEE